ncbi:MAG: cyclase family protein [Acidobacteria bacterium]|nr:cyclase family protein [Acidobacteriota bacterium]
MPLHTSPPNATVALRRLALLASLIAGACGPAPAPTPAAAPVTTPAPVPSGVLVDLSHTYDATTVFWPTAETYRLDKVADGMTPGGYYYAANNFFSSEHGGTHLDAPIHFARGAQSVEQVPLERLFGEAYVIDVVAQASANADHQVSVEDIAAAERAQGPIPPTAIVLLRTGFSTRWPDAARYLGTAERGEAAAAKLHFPGLRPDAARWLVANRTLKAIGIDTASIDYGQSSLFESHRVLYERNIPAFENLTALERLPATGAWLVALPMKIGGGSGAPLRAVAILPEAPAPSGPGS